MSSSDSRRSRIMYNVPLGLYPHIRNGGRSCLEIKVDLHEGLVSFSTLFELCYSRLAHSL